MKLIEETVYSPIKHKSFVPSDRQCFSPSALQQQNNYYTYSKKNSRSRNKSDLQFNSNQQYIFIEKTQKNNVIPEETYVNSVRKHAIFVKKELKYFLFHTFLSLSDLLTYEI